MSYLKKYEYAIAVERHGGISAAADALGISQPTLSKYLKKTEDELGIELFDRSSIPIRTTPAGEAFIRTGVIMLDAEKQFQKELCELKENKSSVIRIGISPSRAPYLMPSILKSYRDSENNANIIIEEKTTDELTASLKSGELDMIISLADNGTESFEEIPLFEEALLLAVPSAFEGDNAEDILRTSPIISVGRGQILWQTVQSIIGALGLKTPEIEAQSIESALALVKSGLGVTVVPSYINSPDSKKKNADVRFIPLPFKGLMRRRVCLFYRHGQYLSLQERALIDSAKSITYI